MDPVRKRAFDYQIELHQKGRTCHGCSGVCCTDKHNSMMVNKEEAALIFDFLKTRPNLDETMVKVSQCIREYRLDFVPPGLKGQTLRKKYTCPFFSGGELGCQLPFEIKPLGCLMFNPVSDGKKGEDCRSEFGPLEDQKEPAAGKMKFSIPYALELIKTGTWPE